MTTARKKFIERLDQAMATAEKMNPEDLAETFKALESFEARSDDVLLVGYPKTGKYIVFFASSENSKLSSRRVFATHIFPHMLPTSIFKNNVKVSVHFKLEAVSYFHFSNSMPSLPSFQTWDEFFNAFLNGKVSWGSYFDHIIEWNKHFDDENIISFQTMKENSHKTHGAFGNVLFRKGSVSDWKNLFTEAQNQEMDKKFEESLAGTKLGAKMKYGVYRKA
uniref:Sulfotransferase n=1 Tax=Chelonoidis abingdonii TaxID=106734 RepID=A0A8C0GW93_CHEAB